MDYGLLPPEINSGRMYTGPGAGSLVAAAAGWGELAADLHSAAAGFQSVISALTSGPWLGPASASLVAAATPYVAWLQSSATDSELAASQAAAAAAAHETAFAMTVPPPVIAANRALLAELLATNFLGQNAPAIAATEGDYFEFWARDAAAMYAYSSSSAAASQLTEFSEPPPVADPSGLARQAAAVSSAVGNSSAVDVQSALPNLNSITGALKMMAAPFSSRTIDDFITSNTSIDDFVTLYTKYISGFMPTATSTAQSTNAIVALTSFMKGLAPAAASAAKAGAPAAAAGATNAAANAGANAAGVAGGLGKALPLGALSVPPSWAPVSAVTNPGVAALNAGVAPAAAEGMNALPMAPFGAMGGNRYGRMLPTYGFKPAVMAKPPAAG
ncbi:hypothetical protein A5660_20135 [Mycobacterium alsense]|uniref:PPE family protein n=1 Tax=Mycobacterium alsense TaxID=324058 RepID=UPI0007FDD50D|nr:PPE family protein [Mycobacterium alsense]OBJ03774.1 hypothetical protein A5660_20135 [Mycobacterium alsense]